MYENFSSDAAAKRLLQTLRAAQSRADGDREERLGRMAEMLASLTEEQIAALRRDLASDHRRSGDRRDDVLDLIDGHLALREICG